MATSGFSPVASARFDTLHSQGLEANTAGDYAQGGENLLGALRISRGFDEPARQIDALQPLARSHWGLGDYEPAQDCLLEARDLALTYGMRDELYMAASNMGRLASVQVARADLSTPKFSAMLEEVALPYFSTAYDGLRKDPHLYFRYTNALYGSITAAMAGDATLGSQLVSEGIGVAFRKSPEPFDDVMTFRLANHGLARLALATAIMPAGAHTPVLANQTSRMMATKW